MRTFSFSKCSSLALALIAASALQLSAANYYVSQTGSDANNGSQSFPFRQIRKALTVVQPGDTVLVADGSYLGFTMDSINGTAVNPITIRATGSAAQVTVTTDRPDNRDTIKITFCSYVILDGLTSFSANRAALRIDQSPNVTVKNGVFGNNTAWGIFTDFSDNLLLQNNECYGSVQQHGIYVSNTCTGPVVRGNRSHDNYACGLHFNGDVSQGGVGLITNALVENNVLYNNGVGGGSAINMDGVQNSVVRNNLLCNNHASGIALFQIDASAGPSNVQILHNTIDMASNARWALLINGASGPITVRNNILYNRNPNRGGISWLSSADVANTDSDFNILDRVTTNDGNSVLTLAAWQQQGHETHSLSSTPAALFVSAGTFDYHLATGSKAIDAGQILASVVVDIEGNARPRGTLSDIGCYEAASGSSPPSAYGLRGYNYIGYSYNCAWTAYAQTYSQNAYSAFAYGYYSHYYGGLAYFNETGAAQTQDYYNAYLDAAYAWSYASATYNATGNGYAYYAREYAKQAYTDFWYAYKGQ